MTFQIPPSLKGKKRDDENAAESPRPIAGNECSESKTDKQNILVLHPIFAEAGKPRLSAKPRRASLIQEFIKINSFDFIRIEVLIHFN